MSDRSVLDARRFEVLRNAAEVAEQAIRPMAHKQLILRIGVAVAAAADRLRGAEIFRQGRDRETGCTARNPTANSLTSRRALDWKSRATASAAPSATSTTTAISTSTSPLSAPTCCTGITETGLFRI